VLVEEFDTEPCSRELRDTKEIEVREVLVFEYEYFASLIGKVWKSEGDQVAGHWCWVFVMLVGGELEIVFRGSGVQDDFWINYLGSRHSGLSLSLMVRISRFAPHPVFENCFFLMPLCPFHALSGFVAVGLWLALGLQSIPDFLQLPAQPIVFLSQLGRRGGRDVEAPRNSATVGGGRLAIIVSNLVARPLKFCPARFGKAVKYI
jgi:hypothetical protein